MLSPLKQLHYSSYPKKKERKQKKRRQVCKAETEEKDNTEKEKGADAAPTPASPISSTSRHTAHTLKILSTQWTTKTTGSYVIDDTLALGVKSKSRWLLMINWYRRLGDHMCPAKMLKNGNILSGKHASLGKMIMMPMVSLACSLTRNTAS
ncbi:hypothetical protein BDQ17DRAFT_1433883 [Cyathus striatus]|nr:hypothetical protein BDQ17DRAFT_1433883 [Cyathus striatus]